MGDNSGKIPRGILILAGTTALTALIWFLIVIPQVEKIPDDFYLYMEQEGKDQIANTIEGGLSEPFKLRESLIQRTVNSDANYITISSTISGVNDYTEEEIFHSDEEYAINRYDFTYKDNPQNQFWFKQNVKTQDYQFYHPLVFADAPLAYQRTETIEGLETYVFRATTSQNDISDRFPQFNDVTILSDTTSDFWIEPTTGNLIKFEKHWTDYTLVGQEKVPVQDGWKRTTNYSVFILAEATKTKIENIGFYSKIVPAFLISLVAGINIILMLKGQIMQINRRLKKSERLAVIGTMAARFAHDLRNPLTVMKAQLGIMALQNEDTVSNGRITKLTSAVERMNRQIDDIVDFIKDKPLKVEKISTAKLIESAIQNTFVPEKTKVILPEADHSLYGDFTQLETVLSNIITNSVQAIREDGTITVSVREDDEFVALEVSDSGPGISSNDMERIFDPLFTTKQDGTGLGLSSCQTIMKSHGGKITVRNNPTTFTLYMPKTQSKITLN